MRKIKFVSEGYPTLLQLKFGLNIAKELGSAMAVGEVQRFGTGEHQTTVTIEDNGDMLVKLKLLNDE